MGDELNPNASLEEPYTADGPTGETLLESIKPLEIEDVISMFNDAVGKLFTRAKMKDAISTPVTLAIDMTYVGYYADGDELRWALGAPDTKEYDWCFKFATAAVVGDNTHFTVAMLPVGHSEYRDAAAYPGDNQYYRVGEVARELLDTARKYVDVSSIVADREFYAADVIEACEERDLFYLIPAVRNDRIRRTLRRFGSEVYVRKEYGIYGPIKGGSDNERVETTLVVLPDDDSRDGPSPFVTNLEVYDERGWDRRRTKEKIERYSIRGAIETSYKKIKEFAAWTTSKAFPVRLYHFGMAVVLYNTWLLVDLLVRVRMVVEIDSGPAVTVPGSDGFSRIGSIS